MIYTCYNLHPICIGCIRGSYNNEKILRCLKCRSDRMFLATRDNIDLFSGPVESENNLDRSEFFEGKGFVLPRGQEDKFRLDFFVGGDLNLLLEKYRKVFEESSELVDSSEYRHRVYEMKKHNYTEKRK
jgi:hypothetical protein